MNKSTTGKLALLLGAVAFLLALISIAIQYSRGRGFDYFHLIFALGLLAFLISIAGRKQ